MPRAQYKILQVFTPDDVDCERHRVHQIFDSNRTEWVGIWKDGLKALVYKPSDIAELTYNIDRLPITGDHVIFGGNGPVGSFGNGSFVWRIDKWNDEDVTKDTIKAWVKQEASKHKLTTMEVLRTVVSRHYWDMIDQYDDFDLKHELHRLKHEGDTELPIVKMSADQLLSDVLEIAKQQIDMWDSKEKPATFEEIIKQWPSIWSLDKHAK